MTTAVKEKKPFLPQRRVAPQASGGAVAIRGASAGRVTVGASPLIIGGEPRVHLLPVEVIERKKFKEVKRRLLFAGVVVLAIVLVGYALVAVSLTAVQSQLAAAQATTAQLVAQQSKYSSVTNVNNDIAAIQQSQKTATAQEILWAPYLLTIESSLPAGASISLFSATTDSPLGAPATASTVVPLQGPRIATVQLTVLMNQADVPGWLNTLPSLTGFVDATPNSVTASNTATGPYTVSVTIHINSDAVSNRFTKTTGDNK
jgi:Tfp pilus assembly protein PilN